MYRTCAIIIALFLTNMAADATHAASVYDTLQKGNKLYQEGKFDEALKIFVDGQIEHADDTNLKYNIASSHYKMKNYDEAVKGYLDVAATAKDSKLAERAFFNGGNALYRQGKLEDAIEYYKKALEFDPDDQDAKHNLEFVREELKRRINEAKETEKKQQEQKQKQEQNQQKDQQQNQGKQQDQNKQQEQQQSQQQQQQQSQEQARNKQEEQKGASQQDQKQQQTQKGEQKQEEHQQAQGQLGTPDKKEGAQSEEAQAIPQQAGKMSKEEAEQLLNTVEENREKFAKKKEQEGYSGQYRPQKDW
jgi:Ca-activated chloride channel family protein